ncbi:hypothetical protein ACU8KH_04238 [Lachancea thermotolerans]
MAGTTRAASAGMNVRRTFNTQSQGCKYAPLRTACNQCYSGGAPRVSVTTGAARASLTDFANGQ